MTSTAPILGWTLDVAREQAPTRDGLLKVCRRTRAAGYAALGLYVEHAFAYASAPWAAGPDALTPDDVRTVQAAARDQNLRLVPFLNTLGHLEGFLRLEHGHHLAEGPGGGLSLQMCPSRPECVAFARGLVSDAIATFDDEWIHLGGDETRQLGQCPQCAARVAQDGPAGLYGAYYGDLCRWVLDQGRRPCLWGDMLLKHPAALDAIPRQTVIFDWQYFNRPAASIRRFRDRGFDVVCCPSVQSYNAAWCLLDETDRNIDEHVEEARTAGALGVWLTTWEACFFSNYAAILPLVYAAGTRVTRGETWDRAIREAGGAAYARVAEILGRSIPRASPFLGPGQWRRLRGALAVENDPFALWQNWRTEACGRVGDEVLRLCREARKDIAGCPELHFAVELHDVSVRWVRSVERAYQVYRDGDPVSAAHLLQVGSATLARLIPPLEQIAAGGGSRADVHRTGRLVEQVHTAVSRLKSLPADQPLPAFDVLTHPRYIQNAQAAWFAGPSAARTDESPDNAEAAPDTDADRCRDSSNPTRST